MRAEALRSLWPTRLKNDDVASGSVVSIGTLTALSQKTWKRNARWKILHTTNWSTQLRTKAHDHPHHFTWLRQQVTYLNKRKHLPSFGRFLRCTLSRPILQGSHRPIGDRDRETTPSSPRIRANTSCRVKPPHDIISLDRIQRKGLEDNSETFYTPPGSLIDKI